MRKILLLAVLATCSFLAQSQIKKGSVLLGGGIGFGQTNSSILGNEYLNRGFSLNPSFGYAFRENHVAGLKSHYSYGVNRPVPDIKQTNTSYGGGPFYRRYFPLGANFYLFGEGILQYGQQKINSPSSDSTGARTNSQNIGLTFFPGVTYAVSRRFHLEAGLNDLITIGYSRNRNINYTPALENTYENKSFNMNLNASSLNYLHIGFRIVLGK